MKTEIHRRCLSDRIATMKAEWISNMEKIDRLYKQRFRMEEQGDSEGLHLIKNTILRLSAIQIKLDHHIQAHYQAKTEFLYNMFLLNKPIQQ